MPTMAGESTSSSMPTMAMIGTAAATASMSRGMAFRVAARGADGVMIEGGAALRGLAAMPKDPRFLAGAVLAAGGAYAAHETYEWYKENQRTADDRAAAQSTNLRHDYDAFHASQGQSWLQQNVQALAREDRAIQGVYNPRTDKGKEKLTDSDISRCETTDPVEGWVDPGFTVEQGRVQVTSTPVPEPARPIVEGFDPSPLDIGMTLEGFDLPQLPDMSILTREKK